MGVTVNFGYQTALGMGKNKDFTNFLKDKDEYIVLITHILSKMIPEISRKSISELRSDKHYHTHTLDDKKAEFAINILRDIVKNCCGYDDNGADQWIDNQGIRMQQLWQISCPDSHGIRIIGFFQGDVFQVLFIDYYHQIYKDEKNNERNISKNEFSILEYVKEKK